MRKPLLALLILLLLGAGYAALSHRFGVLAESAIRDQVRSLSELGIAADVGDYERGLFRSHFTLKADATLFVARAASGAGPEILELVRTIELPVTLSHGPIVLAETGLFGLAAMHADVGAASARLVEGEELEISIPLSLRITTHGLDGRLSVGSFTLGGDGDATQISLDPMALDFATDPAFRTLLGSFRSGDFHFTNAGFRIDAGPVDYRFDLARVGNKLWIGAQSGSLASSAVAADAQGNIFNTGAWRIESATRIEDDTALIGGEARYVIDDLTFAREGRPPFPSDVTIDADFEHFPISAIEDMQSAVELLADTGDDVDDETAALFLERLVEAGNAAAAHRPRIRFGEIALAHAEGTGRISLDAGLAEGARFDASALYDAFNTLAAKGEIRIDHGLLRAISRSFVAPDPANEAEVDAALGMILLQLTASGQFRSEGEQVISDLALGNGVFSMNGRPVFDAAALLGGGAEPIPEPE